MKRYLFAAVAALSLAACSSSPGSVVRDFYGNLDDGNLAEAAEMILPQSRVAWGGKVDAVLLDMSEKIAKCDGIDRLEVVQTEDRGSMRVFKVTVNLKSKGPKCGVKNDIVKTFKADGKWHIFLG